jgi:predicted AAA+ superfamily ATPase
MVRWKEKRGRKPLVIRGARQVGKTSAVLMFGKKHFKEVIDLNLENPAHSGLFREDVSLQDFEKIIQIKFHKRIIPKETLVFIDEIQNSPVLLKLLRFFYEERPELHVIAAGSLLQAKIEREGLSLPVGRIEYAYLYPLDFFEFLEAREEAELLDFLKHVSLSGQIPQGIHREAMKFFHEYTMIGGMPEIVRIFQEERSIEEISVVYLSLFTSYAEDIFKYSSLASSKYLSFIVEKAPHFAGTNITYAKFAGSNFGSREMGKSFDVLEKVMLLNQIPATKSFDLPLVAQKKRPKKLLFLDVGLVNHQMDIRGEFLNLKELNGFYRGKIAEQVVGQNIIAQFMSAPHRIFYWAKEKPYGSAEVDFCMDHKGNILGVEVKSGSHRRLKSLYSFASSVRKCRLIRIYGGELKKENITVNKKGMSLLSLPFYLVPRIFDDFE